MKCHILVCLTCHHHFTAILVWNDRRRMPGCHITQSRDTQHAIMWPAYSHCCQFKENRLVFPATFTSIGEGIFSSGVFHSYVVTIHISFLYFHIKSWQTIPIYILKYKSRITWSLFQYQWQIQYFTHISFIVHIYWPFNNYYDTDLPKYQLAPIITCFQVKCHKAKNRKNKQLHARCHMWFTTPCYPTNMITQLSIVSSCVLFSAQWIGCGTIYGCLCYDGGT